MKKIAEIVPGIYWAKWEKCDEGTEDFEIFEPHEHWEPVQVTENHRAANHPQHLRVFVIGFAGSQDIHNFFWGPRISDSYSMELPK